MSSADPKIFKVLHLGPEASYELYLQKAPLRLGKVIESRIPISYIATHNSRPVVFLAGWPKKKGARDHHFELQIEPPDSPVLQRLTVESEKERKRRVARSKRAERKAPPKFRVWISADQQFRVEAKLLAVTEASVRLQKKENNAVIEVQLSDLSQQDRAYVQGHR